MVMDKEILVENNNCDESEKSNNLIESENSNNIIDSKEITDSKEIIDNEEIELEWLIKQKNELKKEEERIRLEEIQFEEELKQHIEDTKNNFAIFLHWIKNINCLSEDLYNIFCNDFSEEYRSQLFENICEFFKDESFVTDEILFYWKSMVVNLLKKSKKYRNSIEDLVFDPVNQITNLKIVKEKYIFKCFIDDERVCYFKENGTDYYVS